MKDSEKNKKLLLNFTLFSIIDIITYALIMLIILSSFSKLNDAVDLSENGYITLFIVTSVILGVVISFILSKVFLKRKTTSTVIYFLLMFLIHILIFFMLYISGLDIIDKIVESLSSEDYMHELFYNEYFYKAIIFGLSYDDWKTAMIEQITNYIPTMKNYAQGISLIFVCGSYAGIIIEMIVYKIQTKFNKEKKSME